jgi:hypothetical protein
MPTDKAEKATTEDGGFSYPTALDAAASIRYLLQIFNDRDAVHFKDAIKHGWVVQGFAQSMLSQPTNREAYQGSGIIPPKDEDRKRFLTQTLLALDAMSAKADSPEAATLVGAVEWMVLFEVVVNLVRNYLDSLQRREEINPGPRVVGSQAGPQSSQPPPSGSSASMTSTRAASAPRMARHGLNSMNLKFSGAGWGAWISVMGCPVR